MLALGLGLIAFVLIIPATDEQAALADERDRLRAQLDSLIEQRDQNADFLERIHADPELAWRLIERQRPAEAGRLRAEVLAAEQANRPEIQDDFAELARATLDDEDGTEQLGVDEDVEVIGQVAAKAFGSSPFALLTSEPAVMPTPRKPLGGMLANWCRTTRGRLTLIGLGGFACLLGLLGGGRGTSER